MDGAELYEMFRDALSKHGVDTDQSFLMLDGSEQDAWDDVAEKVERTDE